jgi:hypothetical protein
MHRPVFVFLLARANWPNCPGPSQTPVNPPHPFLFLASFVQASTREQGCYRRALHVAVETPTLVSVQRPLLCIDPCQQKKETPACVALHLPSPIAPLFRILHLPLPLPLPFFAVRHEWAFYHLYQSSFPFLASLLFSSSSSVRHHHVGW